MFGYSGGLYPKMGSKTIIFVAQTVRLETMFLVSNERSSSREFSGELSVYIMYNNIVPSFFHYYNKMYVIYIIIIYIMSAPREESTNNRSMRWMEAPLPHWCLVPVVGMGKSALTFYRRLTSLMAEKHNQTYL